MSDYLILSNFEELDSNSENEIVYNTSQYAAAGEGGGYASLSEMKKLAGSLKNSGKYLKSLLTKSGGGSSAQYGQTLMAGSGAEPYGQTLMSGGAYPPAGYQRGYSSAYQNAGYVGAYNNGASTYPNTKDKKGFYSENADTSSTSAAAFQRPLPPSGPRTAQLQSKGGQTREVLPMDKSGYAHDRAHATVQYMEKERAARYQVEIGARLKRRGAAFDTKEIKKAYTDKVRNDPDKYAMPGQAVLGKGTMSKEDMRRWGRDAMIWVCASSGAGSKPIFYSGVGKINKIHHSSFTGGDAVIGAGEWIVEGGKLLFVSANSGHYRPTLDSLYAAMLHMSQAFLPETKVLMWDSKAKIYVHRPVKDFISAPSYNGLYRVHKDA